LFIAAEVVRELQNPGFSEREAALRMIRSLNLLEHTPEAIDLAEVLVAEKVMPAPAIAGDALHVATAAVHRMDYILSWNVRHLANPNKRMHLAVICMRLNLSAPQLVTPDLLWEVSDG
jgi:predicted nucleic acid-binding protein